MITRNVKAVEISRPDADRYNSSFAVKMANFETFTQLSTARKEESPQILLHLEVDWSYYFCFIIDLSLGQLPLLRNYHSALLMQITFPSEQIKSHFKKMISQPTYHRMQPLNLETINQS